jgi:hypothetical protein
MTSFVVDRMDRHPTRYSEGQVTSTTLPARMRYTYLLFVLTICLPTLVQFNTAVGVVPGPSRTFSPAPMARTSTQSVSNSACAYTSKETTETTVPAHGSRSKAKYLGAIQTVSALPSSSREQYGGRQMSSLHPGLRNLERSSLLCDSTVCMTVCSGLQLAHSRIYMFFGSPYAPGKQYGGGARVPCPIIIPT